MKSFGTSPVPDLFARRTEAQAQEAPRFLFRPLGLLCPRCGRSLAVEEHVLFGGTGTTFSIGCFVPLDRGARMGGDHGWDISETEARQLAALVVGDAAARRELTKRVKRITKGKTAAEKLK